MSYLAQVWRNRCALGVHSPQNVHGASAFRGICFLLFSMLSFDALVQSASVAGPKVEHQGVCPNKLNGNLWVDAQSTCERECNIDEDCAEFEKCCTNVCGLNSCVAARFSDGPPAQPEGQYRGTGDGGPATCQGFLCSQQGATCDIWEGQPICKCQDRCEKEPNFTCASDGLTYFNRCYMDAEACIRGGTLTVVTCRFYLAGPPTSPLPTAFPTSISSLEDALPPTLFSNPTQPDSYVRTITDRRLRKVREALSKNTCDA